MRNTRATLRYTDGNSFEFDIIGKDKPQAYLIRVSSQYAWHQGTVTKMRLAADEPIQLMCAVVAPGD